MLLIQASKANSECSKAYKMGILVKIVNGFKFYWWFICLDTWISDTSDPTDLKIKKTICFVPFNHLDQDSFNPG